MLSKIQQSYYRQRVNHSLRVQAIFSLFVLVSCVLLYRLYHLQIVHGDTYLKRSQLNQYITSPLQAQRGKIYDRNHTLLATNVPIYHIDIRYSKYQAAKQALSKLKTLLTLNSEEVAALKDKLASAKHDQLLRVAKNMSLESLQPIYRELSMLDDVEVTPEFIRYYPMAESCVSVTGYSVSKNRQKETIRHADTKHIVAHYGGISGIEQYYDDLLSGTSGSAQYQRNAKGHLIAQTATHEAVPGHDLVLTIDGHLQDIIHKHMQGHRGAVVITNPKSGEVLALYSAPSYDPNIFTNPALRSKISNYLTDKNKPLFNRTIQGLFPPASTIKPFLALHALQNNTIDAKTTIMDPGYFRFGNSEYIYYNWLRSGHGKVDVKKAITVSNDTFFYHLALKLGIDNIHEILSRYGFDRKSDIDLPGEVSGLVPSRAWKERQGKTWYKGDTIITGIGQGSLITTPVQMANSLSILAASGQSPQLHLLDKYIDNKGHTYHTDTKTQNSVTTDAGAWRLIRSAMRDVIEIGTGKRFKSANFEMAGKTGTAQLIKNSGKDQGYAKHLLDHSWFIGFTPVEAPHLAITVLLEHENGALLVAKAILDDYHAKQHPTLKESETHE